MDLNKAHTKLQTNSPSECCGTDDECSSSFSFASPPARRASDGPGVSHTPNTVRDATAEICMTLGVREALFGTPSAMHTDDEDGMSDAAEEGQQSLRPSDETLRESTGLGLRMEPDATGSPANGEKTPVRRSSLPDWRADLAEYSPSVPFRDGHAKSAIPPARPNQPPPATPSKRRRNADGLGSPSPQDPATRYGRAPGPPRILIPATQDEDLEAQAPNPLREALKDIRTQTLWTRKNLDLALQMMDEATKTNDTTPAEIAIKQMATIATYLADFRTKVERLGVSTAKERLLQAWDSHYIPTSLLGLQTAKAFRLGTERPNLLTTQTPKTTTRSPYVPAGLPGAEWPALPKPTPTAPSPTPPANTYADQARKNATQNKERARPPAQKRQVKYSEGKAAATISFNANPPSLWGKETNSDLADRLRITLQDTLKDEKTPENNPVRLVSAFYNDRGNIKVIFTEGTNPLQVEKAAKAISNTYGKDYHTSVHLDIPWSRMAIAGVPTRLASGCAIYARATLKSEVSNNEILSSISFKHDPDWTVRPEDITSDRATIAFAFEDPTGAIKKAILKNPTVHMFGATLRVTERHPLPIFKQCTKCHGLGHDAARCPARERCAQCGKNHRTENHKQYCAECKVSPPGPDNRCEHYRCVNCEGPHLATDPKCPRRNKFRKPGIERIYATRPPGNFAVQQFQPPLQPQQTTSNTAQMLVDL